MLQRVLALLAAMLLVGAVALAMLGPPAVPLGQVLFMVDHDLMEAVHGFIGTHLAAWLWDYLVLPLMLRPAWLVPAALGLLCGGASLSLSTRKSTHRSHRRS
ncbi:MAG TPA: hypothetical protein VFE12_00090 [Acetobacteraceae bacterium]|nr:hypothetical protein [Acetobacteraceae bacterium]